MEVDPGRQLAGVGCVDALLDIRRARLLLPAQVTTRSECDLLSEVLDQALAATAAKPAGANPAG